jgi:hypothetical protein
MTTQVTLTGGRPQSAEGHPLGEHIDARAAVGDTYDGRCTDCGRSVRISESGVERGHDTDCEHQGREAGGEL